MGVYFEDLSVDQEFITPARTVTEHDVLEFAGLSGDYNPLHTDEEFCRQTQFGRRIAHGLLGLSITSGLLARLGLFDGTAIAFLGLNWNFTGPIFFGDTIHAKMTIKEKRETSKKDRGIIIREVEVINQRGEVVQKGELKLMVRRRNP